MRSVLLAAFVGGSMTCGAVASNVINEHGPYTEGVHFTIDQFGGDDVGVLIRQDSSSSIWKFEAYDSETGDPGYINYIRIQPTGDVGLINLQIVGAPGHTYGARDVKKIDLLTHADNTTRIYSVYISGDLGEVDSLRADYVGSEFGGGGIYAGGDLLHSISPVEDITAPVTIGGDLLAGIYADTAASITVNGTGPHTGDIITRQSGAGAIDIGGTMNGDIKIGGAMSNSIRIRGNLGGSLEIGTNPCGPFSGSILIDDNVLDTGLNHVHIYQMVNASFECDHMALNQDTSGGTVTGEWMEIGSAPASSGTLQTGTIRINGTLSGTLHLRAQCQMDIHIGEINAGPDAWDYIDYGGVWIWGGFTNQGQLTVEGPLRRGFIYARGVQTDTNENGMLGTISIQGDLGQATAGNVARIWADYTWGDPVPPMDIGATIHIDGNVYSSSGTPAISATGDLNGEIQITGSLLNGAGDEIEIGGALTGSAAIAVNWDGHNDTSDSADDEWESGAIVRVGSTGYTGNTPAAHI